MSFISVISETSENSDGTNNVLDAEAYKNEGNRRLKNHNDIQGSIDAYTKAIVLAKSNYVYYNNRAVPYLMLQQYDRAIADCDTSLDLCKNVKAYCRKASALGMMGRYEEGITTVLRALDINPKDKESSVVLETILRDKSKVLTFEDDTPAGIQIKELNEKLIKKRANDLVAEGKIHVRNNNFQDGVGCFTQAITLSPNSAKFYFYRAMAHKINGDYKKCFADCDNSWNIQKNVEAYNLKASLLRNMKKYNDALDCVLKCLELDPENKDSVYLHEKISKEKLNRNRAPTLTLKDYSGSKSKQKSSLRINTKQLLRSPSSFMSKLSSPRNRVYDEDLPWYEVPLKHTRDDTVVKNGVVRIVDRFEWQDLPVEYNRVLQHKHIESRNAKSVRMKNIERKKEDTSTVRQYCSLAYVTVVGAIQRALSTDSSRRSSVSPEVRRNRALTPVSM
jgi:tetratricopeptide (TPR) repeat protein